MKALVLDTSSFIQGFDNSDPNTVVYTTYLVQDEVRDEMARIRLENWVRTGRLTVRNPGEESMRMVHEASVRLGERRALSDTDHSVIALALELSSEHEATVISDDYSVQNLCDELDIGHTGLATRGIKRRFKWVHYCPGCRRQFTGPQEDDVCPVCGTGLKRKPGKKSPRRRA